MAVTLKKLYRENILPFKLSLLAGQNGIHNVVSWVYMLEDESITSYFHGSELAVTTCMKMPTDSNWLLSLISRLVNCHAAGLLINTGNFIYTIPENVIDFCNIHDFPLFTMPWEIKITDVVQNFCIRIMNEQHDSALHDKAMRDAILRMDNEEEYRDTLARYYDLDGTFTIISIYTKAVGNPVEQENSEYHLETRMRRLRADMVIPETRMGLVTYENYLLIILNNASTLLLSRIEDTILDVYKAFIKTGTLFIGVGTEVLGLSNIYKSFNRANTAMRMAIYRNEPVIQFEQMGFYKILFSIKDDEVLYAYANEILAPLDQYDAKNHNYIELLKVYIQQDRSLEGTARAMYLHRNTVNYRVQKMKELLGSPLKTVEDLFPYQVALAIRDMEKTSSEKFYKHLYN